MMIGDVLCCLCCSAIAADDLASYALTISCTDDVETMRSKCGLAGDMASLATVGGTARTSSTSLSLSLVCRMTSFDEVSLLTTSIVSGSVRPTPDCTCTCESVVLGMSVSDSVAPVAAACNPAKLELKKLAKLVPRLDAGSNAAIDEAIVDFCASGTVSSLVTASAAMEGAADGTDM